MGFSKQEYQSGLPFPSPLVSIRTCFLEKGCTKSQRNREATWVLVSAVVFSANHRRFWIFCSRGRVVFWRRDDLLCGRFAAAAAAKLLQSCPTLCDPIDSPGKNPDVGCHFLLQCMKVKSEREISQLCPTLSDPMDCSPAGSSVHGIFQARVLEWGAASLTLDNH